MSDPEPQTDDSRLVTAGTVEFTRGTIAAIGLAGLFLAGCATHQPVVNAGVEPQETTTNNGYLFIADGSVHLDPPSGPVELYINGKVVLNRSEERRFEASGKVLGGSIVIGGRVPRFSSEPSSQNAYEDAIKVLYLLSDSVPPIVTGRSPLYATYLKDSDAYAMARIELAAACRDAMADPQKMASWPRDGTIFADRTDKAWQRRISDGALRVENALGVIAASSKVSENDLPAAQGSSVWMELATGSAYLREPERPFIKVHKLENGMFVPSSREVIY